MKVTSNDQDIVSSFSSSSSASNGRSNGNLTCWISRIRSPYRDFCGLSLELFARPVMNTETVLPKTAVTVWKKILRLNLSVASAALRDARQRYLWKGEW